MLRLCLRSQVRAGLASAFNFRALSTSVLRPIPLVRPQQGSLLASSFLRNTNFSTFSGLRYEAVPSPSEARSVEGESAEEPEPVVPSSRLYIGNLPFDLAEKALYDFVRPFGQIADITMRRGYALVEFTSLSSSTAFYQKVQQSPPVVGSRTLKVEFASGDGKRTFSRPSIEPHETVYLAGFDSSVTEQDLAEFAQGYGEVRSIRFVPGAKFAHIHFETLDAAEACVDAASGGSQSRSLGPRLSVEFSAKKSPRGRRETEPRAEPSTKVFVGNLHEIEKEEFEEYLTSYGPESVFMKLEKGFAILDFPTIEAATHFVSQSHQIGPQRLRVNFSTTSLDSPSATRGRDNSSRRTQQGGPKKGNQKAADRPENPPNTRVFVANCPLNAPEEMIRELAEPFGKVVHCESRLDKGFAFLHFATLEEATAFVTECKQNAPTWEGRSLHVQFAVDNHQAGGGTPREPQPKVFIGGMHGVTQEQLTEYLKLYGPLENLWIHQERGFGLVDFPTTEAAQSFVSASPHIIGSTTLRVNFSERTTEDPGYQLSRGPIKDPKPPSSTVLIGNLAKDVTVDDLNAVVEPFGPIMSINIPRKPDGASKGAALVMFDSIEKATAFIAHVAENITLVNGRTVRAEFGKESTKIPRKISTHTPSKTVFIGNVPYDATEEDLRSITEPFGNVQGVKIGRNGQGAATGYALIHFEELDSSISFVQDAISRPPRIRDRHVRADFSNLAFMDFGGTAAKASFTGTVYKPTKTVWIGNDLESVREEEVRELCEQFGELTAIRAGFDRRGVRRGFFHVDFATLDAATAFINSSLENPPVIAGHKLRVDYAPHSSDNIEPSQIVFVSNLPPNFEDESALRQWVEPFGGVAQIRIGQSVGNPNASFAHIHFTNLDSAVNFVNNSRESPHKLSDRILGATFSVRQSGKDGEGRPRDESATVFIGNLSVNATKEQVMKVLRRYGEVLDLRISKDKRIAHADFVSIPAAVSFVSALSAGPVAIDGRNLFVDFATKGGEQQKVTERSGHVAPATPSKTLFTSGWPTGFGEEEIRALFVNFAGVRRVTLHTKATGVPTVQAFVEFDNKYVAKDVLEQLNIEPLVVGGQSIYANFAAPSMDEMGSVPSDTLLLKNFGGAESELMAVLDQHREHIVASWISRIPETQEPTGAGFARFDSVDKAEEVLQELQGKEIQPGQTLQLLFSHKRQGGKVRWAAPDA